MHDLGKISRQGCCFLMVITFTTTGSFAQNAMIQGVIKDENIALPNATVSVANKSIITNLKGEFSIVTNPGNYTLVVTHSGYQKFEKEINAKANETQTLTINLIRAEQLGEVVVLGSRSFIQRSNLNTTVPVDLFSFPPAQKHFIV